MQPNHKCRQLRVGCSGWQYRHWRGDFYPAELPQSRWFSHYALTFDTVEINNSFYRLPDGGDIRQVARAGAARLPLRRQGEPVPHAHEEAQGSGGAARRVSSRTPGTSGGTSARSSTSFRRASRSTWNGSSIS